VVAWRLEEKGRGGEASCDCANEVLQGFKQNLITAETAFMIGSKKKDHKYNIIIILKVKYIFIIFYNESILLEIFF
jgi:hypothetical protein